MRQQGGGVVAGKTQFVGATRLGLAGFGTWVDAGNRFTTPPVVDGTGITFVLTGGWSTTDPFSGPHVIGPPVSMDTALEWMGRISVIERSPPDLVLSDLYVCAGFCNEAADSGTIDAIYWGILYGTSTRTVRKGIVANGAATVNNGSSDDTLRIVDGLGMRQGLGATARWFATQGRALDAAGAIVSGAAFGNSEHVCTGGTANPRPFLAIHRVTAVDVVDETLTIDFARGPVVGSAVAL